MAKKRVGLCAKCGEILEDAERCSICGGDFARTAIEVETWEDQRLVRRIAVWETDGLIDAKTAKELVRWVELRGLVKPKESGGESVVEPGKPHAVERGADALVGGAATFWEELSTRYSRMVAEIEADGAHSHAEAAPASSPRPQEGIEAGRAVFARGQGTIAPGIEALGELDEDQVPGESKPLGALQVFWFIGTLLVLSGSVMGVREAWRSLEGAWRPLAIAGALFGYHAAFVVLARFLARRSTVTGRVLGGIATGLLPIVMVAAAVARAISPNLGFFAGAGLIVASTISLVLTGSVYAQGAGLGLAVGLVPSFALELLRGGADVSTHDRVRYPLLALVPVLIAAIASRTASSMPGQTRSTAAWVGSLYGAISVFIFAFFGGPDVPVLDVSVFGAPLLGAIAWTAGLGTTVWMAVHNASNPRAIPAWLPRAAPVLTIMALALVLGAACAGAISTIAAERVDLFATGPFVWVPTLVAGVGVLLLCYEATQRPSAIHLAVPLAFVAVALGTNVLSVAPLPFPVATTAIVPAAMFLLAPFTTAPRRALVVWAALTSLGVTLATLSIEYAVLNSDDLVNAPCLMAAQVAASLALAAHLGGRSARPLPHYWGALLALIAAMAYFVPNSPEPFSYWLGMGFIALAIAYGTLALPYGLWAPKAEAKPFDDISLFAALGVAWLSILVIPPVAMVPSTRAEWNDALAQALPALAAAAILVLRSIRDESLILTVHAGLAIAAAVEIIGGRSAPPAFLTGLVALALVIPGALRVPNAEGSSKFGRAIFGFIPLPFGARGRTLLDGIALAGFWLALRAAFGAADWIGNVATGGLDTARSLVLFGLFAVIAVALLAFSTRAIEVLNARGHVATLVALGITIVLAALTNRIGRPLPPAIVARNLTLVAIVVWFVAQFLVRVGPRLGRALERPAHGPLYHYVAHAGVGALGILLSIDAYVVGAPLVSRALAVVPPLFPLGAAIAFLLLYRSSTWVPFFHAALASLFGFAALVGSQRAVLGPALTPLDSPGGRWVLSSVATRAREGWLDPAFFLPLNDAENLQRVRALVGGSIFVLACAGFLILFTRSAQARQFVAVRVFAGTEETDAKQVKLAFEVWAAIASVIIALELSSWPALLPSLVLLAAGVLAIAARSLLLRAVLPWLGASLLVHAAAHLGSTIPDWAGPVMALLSSCAVLGGWYLTRRHEYNFNMLAGAHLIAIVLGYFGIVYSLAVGATTSQNDAAVVLLLNAFSALDGSWAASFSLSMTLTILAISGAIAAWSYRSALSTFLSVPPPLVLAGAGLAAAANLVYTTPDDVFPRLITRNGPLAGGLVALTVLGAHIIAVVLAWRKLERLRQGIVVGRDLALILGVGVMMLYVLGPEPGGVSPSKWGVLALALPLVVSIDSIARFGTARHVYLAQSLVVALYAFVTQSMNLRPDLDALLGLAYGFTLLGVAIIARRQKLTTVADATRRFLVVLPAFVALFTMQDSTNTTALFALGSCVLYGTIAVAERSRILGSLAAIAGNLALIVFALAQGLDGLEIYVGPLGLLVMVLAQIFSSKLDPGARTALRVLGGVLLYVPSGFKLALRLGAAEDPTYSVVFGVVCLLGVLAGVLLRIRAYLALATLALTLDVVANLIHAGLRDHRLGFILLSASGLSIIALMILVTLRKDAAWALVTRLRAKLGGWE